MTRFHGWGLALLLYLVPAVLPSCVLTATEGAQVSLSVEGLMAPATSGDGVAVTLDELFLHVDSAELVACGDAGEASLEHLLRASVARAHHGAAEGTILATPHLLELHEDPMVLGTFRPPPGRYCEVHLNLSPAVAQTDGVAAAMLGFSLFGHGSLGGPPRQVYGQGIAHWELPLAAPLTLGDGQLAADVSVKLDVSAAIAEVRAGDAELFGGEVLRALPNHAVVGEPPRR